MKKLLFLFLFVSPLYAEGPFFDFKDPSVKQEFDNVYKDIRNKIASPLNVSSGTVTILNGSTITATTRFIAPVGSDAAPGITFNNNDPDTGISSVASDRIGISAGGVRALDIATARVQIFNVPLWVGDGSVGAPSISFALDTDTGIHRSATNQISLVTGGSARFIIDTTELITQVTGGVVPSDDNVMSVGKSGKRYTAIWAANGTIQTSSSKRKAEIREIEFDKKSSSLKNLTDKDVTVSSYSAKTSGIKVPRGIIFKWKDKEGKAGDRDLIGFVGDDLPEEAHAIREDGTRDPENFYLSAVVGILSAKIIELEKRIEALEQK